MPVPPRPIPRRPTRPGHAVPHKACSQANQLDWRAEVALLDSYALSKPQSLPSAGVMIMDAAIRAKMASTSSTSAVVSRGLGMGTSEGGQREVRLEELIQDGKGKREKRASTAATLGFDLIHNPSVVVLPDTCPSPIRPKHSPKRAHTSSPLSNTPQTPALIATSHPKLTSHGEAIDEDDSDLDEWEHVEVDSLDKGDEDMVLGELELEDDLKGLTVIDRKEAVGMRRIEGLSYAAALRT